MAITLRNKAVEEKIRQLAQKRRIGPSAVIAEAIDREIKQEAQAAEHKLRTLQKIRSRSKPFSDKERDDFWKELDVINEELFTEGASGKQAKSAK